MRGTGQPKGGGPASKAQLKYATDLAIGSGWPSLDAAIAAISEAGEEMPRPSGPRRIHEAFKQGRTRAELLTKRDGIYLVRTLKYGRVQPRHRGGDERQDPEVPGDVIQFPS